VFVEVSIAPSIAFGPIAEIVRASVDLDHQPRVTNEEISDVPADRMLAAHLET